MDNQTKDSKDLSTLEAEKEELKIELEAENEITAEYKCAKDAFSDEVDKAGKSFKIYKIKSILKGAGICAFFMIIAIGAKLSPHRILGELAYNLFTQNFVVTICGAGVIATIHDSIKQYILKAKTKKEEIAKLEEQWANYNEKYESQVKKAQNLEKQIDQVQGQIDLRKRAMKDFRRDLARLNILGMQNHNAEEDRKAHLSR